MKEYMSDEDQLEVVEGVGQPAVQTTVGEKFNLEQAAGIVDPTKTAEVPINQPKAEVQVGIQQPETSSGTTPPVTSEQRQQKLEGLPANVQAHIADWEKLGYQFSRINEGRADRAVMLMDPRTGQEFPAFTYSRAGKEAAAAVLLPPTPRNIHPDLEVLLYPKEREGYSDFEPPEKSAILTQIKGLKDPATGNPLTADDQFQLMETVLARFALHSAFVSWNLANLPGSRAEFIKRMQDFNLKRSIFQQYNPEFPNLVAAVPGFNEAMTEITAHPDYFKREDAYNVAIRPKLVRSLGNELAARAAMGLAKKYLIAEGLASKYGGPELRRVPSLVATQRAERAGVLGRNLLGGLIDILQAIFKR